MISDLGADTCPNCGHRWHGLACQHGANSYAQNSYLLANSREPTCECPTAFKGGE